MTDLEKVKYCGAAIKDVKEQTEELCLIAVRENPKFIRLIENPSIKVCLEAVSQDGLVLEYIKHHLLMLWSKAGIQKNT